MVLRKGQRSNRADVIDPVDMFSKKLSIQGDGSGVTVNNVAGKAITGATNATPIVVTATAHGFSNGDLVFVSGVVGNTNANGLRLVSAKTDNTFELTDLLGVAIAGNAAYTSDGLIFPCLWYKVPSGNLLLIEKFSLHASDATSTGDGYMGLGALTNGIRLEIYRGATLRKELHSAPIKDFADWGFVGGVSINNTGLQGGSDAIGFATGSLGEGILKLDGDNDDSIIIIAQDDLSGLIHQESAISGFLESTT